MNLSMVRVLKGFERLVWKVLLMQLLNVIFVVYYIFQRGFVPIISFSLAFLYPPWKRQKTSEVSVMKWVKETPKISINPFIHNVVKWLKHSLKILRCEHRKIFKVYLAILQHCAWKDSIWKAFFLRCSAKSCYEIFCKIYKKAPNLQVVEVKL